MSRSGAGDEQVLAATFAGRVIKQGFSVTPHNCARRSISIRLEAAVERAYKEIQRRFVAIARKKRQGRA
jgi:hypothetical protein